MVSPLSPLSISASFFLHNNVPSFFSLPRVGGDCPQCLSFHGFLTDPHALLSSVRRNNQIGLSSVRSVKELGSHCVDTDKGGHHWGWDWGQDSSQGLGVLPPTTRAEKQTYALTCQHVRKVFTSLELDDTLGFLRSRQSGAPPKAVIILLTSGK